MITLNPEELASCAVNSIGQRTDDDSYMAFLRFTDRQMQVYESNAQYHQMSLCSSGIYLELETDGEELSFDCLVAQLSPSELVLIKGDTTLGDILHTLGETLKNVFWAGGQIDVSQHFDLYMNDSYIDSVGLGSGRLVFTLPNPGHQWVNVKIWFPLYKPFAIRCLSINGEWRNAREKLPVLYALGDSITQGFVAGKPSFCYVAQLAEMLGVRALNQGIGGALFDSTILEDFENLPRPDMVSVAYGTNDWADRPSLDQTREQMTLFFRRLNQLYPDVPTVVLSPIWRADLNESKPGGTFASISRLILDIAGAYPQVRLFDGLRLSPHSTAFYADGFLHPNIAGFSYLALRLFREIRKAFPAA